MGDGIRLAVSAWLPASTEAEAPRPAVLMTTRYWRAEGQFRAIHRKISTEPPPYTMFGPYHTFKRADALPLVPGEVAEIAFDLFPISVRFRKGQRIRVAIAGADKDVFKPIPGCEAPIITIERNARHASFIDLPVVHAHG
ncbi:MAG: hypothetical protein JRH15_20960 [Deltaproteobacteria bacterium]|nr:hypothetical protein [Deltaproteobacteria bacterium]